MEAKVNFRVYANLIFLLIYIKSAENSLYNGNNIVDQDLEEFTLDLAIKLKKEFSDDPVSDLFAASYDLQKIARVCSKKQILRNFKL